MAVLVEKVYLVKPEKTPSFTARMSKPMLTKAFLKDCERSAKSIRELKKK